MSPFIFDIFYFRAAGYVAGRKGKGSRLKRSRSEFRCDWLLLFNRFLHFFLGGNICRFREVLGSQGFVEIPIPAMEMTVECKRLKWQVPDILKY